MRAAPPTGTYCGALQRIGACDGARRSQQVLPEIKHASERLVPGHLRTGYVFDRKIT
jgi:hypothetical protein